MRRFADVHDPSPLVSIVVPAWDQLHLTRSCVASIRAATDVPHELIVVDNGSRPAARDFAREAADIAICNDENVGFARANNQGLAVASGTYVMFLNNDADLPEGWTRLIDTLEAHPRAGLVVPALTAAGVPLTVRAAPVEEVATLPPFGDAPSGVCYLMRRELLVELAGWNEAYPIAAGEDRDLAFTIWTNDLDIVFDAGVLVRHVGHGTADVKLENRDALWSANNRRFVERWSDPDLAVPRIDTCDPGRHDRNRRIAATIVRWRDLYDRNRRRVVELEAQRDAARTRADELHARLRGGRGSRRWLRQLVTLVFRRGHRSRPAAPARATEVSRVS
jgi:GT2 family glycosyltransferase